MRASHSSDWIETHKCATPQKSLIKGKTFRRSEEKPARSGHLRQQHVPWEHFITLVRRQFDQKPSVAPEPYSGKTLTHFSTRIVSTLDPRYPVIEQ